MEKFINYVKKQSKKEVNSLVFGLFLFFIFGVGPLLWSAVWSAGTENDIIDIIATMCVTRLFPFTYILYIFFFVGRNIKYKWLIQDEFNKIINGKSNHFDINLLETNYPVEKILYLKKESLNFEDNDIKNIIEHIQEKLRVINFSKEEKDGYIELGALKTIKVSVEELYCILNNYDEALVVLYLDKVKISNHLDKIKKLPAVLNKEYNTTSYLSKLLTMTGSDEQNKEIENILSKDSGEKTINFGENKISEKALIAILNTSVSLSFILEHINLLSLQKYASQFLNKNRLLEMVSTKKDSYREYLLSLQNTQLSIEQYSYLKKYLSNFDYCIFEKNNPINLHFNDIQMFVQHWNSDILVIDQKKKNLLHDIVNYDIKQYHSMEKNCIKSEQISANLVDCKNLILNKINEILIGKETVKYMSANK